VSSVRYEISEDRLFYSTGILNQKYEQLQLYLIRDLSVTRTLGQRLCGVGNVIVTTVEGEIITLENIRAPYHVKELIYSYMEEEKRKKWYRRADYFYRGSEWVA
jgi:uncharacterized membrane protein YdbT with pleckstrin-like domain